MARRMQGVRMQERVALAARKLNESVALVRLEPFDDRIDRRRAGIHRRPRTAHGRAAETAALRSAAVAARRTRPRFVGHRSVVVEPALARRPKVLTLAHLSSTSPIKALIDGSLDERPRGSLVNLSETPLRHLRPNLLRPVRHAIPTSVDPCKFGALIRHRELGKASSAASRFCRRVVLRRQRMSKIWRPHHPNPPGRSQQSRGRAADRLPRIFKGAARWVHRTRFLGEFS